MGHTDDACAPAPRWNSIRSSKALTTTEEALAYGAERSDISFQTFETYWHIAQAAQRDQGLDEGVRAKESDALIEAALDQLELTLGRGFADLRRLERFPEYEGLRGVGRYKDLVTELGSRAK